MGTAEILIVFSALMALIALVTIGIDWIGKPLKNRRFIPRIYRFEDEKLPLDAYGHPDFGVDVVEPQLPARTKAPAKRKPPARRERQPAPRTVASLPASTAGATPTVSTATAFSDSLAPPASAVSADPMSRVRSTIAGTTDAPARSNQPWKPGMALDTSVDDRKPNLATKAERFWMATAATTAATVSGSHFDDDDVARMTAGKGPRRLNPRTGKAETMQLTGLRRASATADVRMRWPDDAVDPWNAT